MFHTATPRALALSLFACSLAGAPALGQGGASGFTELVSQREDGAAPSEYCHDPVISADGRRVAFYTLEPLLPEDTNDKYDVYVRDLESGELVCASLDYWGQYTSGSSSRPAISADGRYVAFATTSPDLVLFDFNDASDIIRMDLETMIPRRVSQAEGSVLAANGACSHPVISDDGRYVAFETQADDLLPGDTNGTWDVYVKDMETDIVQRASVGNFGESNGRAFKPSISADGSRVVFHSDSDNLVAFDTNERYDVFLRDLDVGSTLRVSRGVGGLQANDTSSEGVISADGQRVLFRSRAANLVPGDTNVEWDAFLHDLASGETQLVTESLDGGFADDFTHNAALSRNGRYAALRSVAQNLTPEASDFTDVFLRDLETGDTWLVHRPDGVGELADGPANDRVSVSDDGTVVFTSSATNLHPDDDNDVRDVFVRRTIPDPVTYCDSMMTAAGCVPKASSTGVPSVSASSGFVVRATNVPPDRAALLFYGFSGRRALPFMGGTHCVKMPVRRTRLLFSSAVGAGDCGGLLSFDMNAFASGSIPGNPAAELSEVGKTVNAQFWGRDPGAPEGVFLTDAIEYVVGP